MSQPGAQSSAQAELSWPLCGNSIFHKVKVNLFTSGLSIHFYSIDSKYLFLLNLPFESVTKHRLKELLPLKAHPGLRMRVEPGWGCGTPGLVPGQVAGQGGERSRIRNMKHRVPAPPHPSWSSSCQPAAHIPAQPPSWRPQEEWGGRALRKNVGALHGSQEGDSALPAHPACWLFSSLPTSAPHILPLP